MFFEALSFSLPDTLAQQRRLAPEPGMRIPSPSGAVLAGTGTFSASEWFAIAQKDEKVAKLLQGQEEKLKGLEPLLKMMGSDITFTLGVDGEPSNPMVLLGSLFVRLDIGGGQPRETMEGLVELARGLELPTDKLRPAEGGYDLFIPPVVLIRLRADDRSLSIAYGREAKPDPESALMKLAEGQLQAGLFDGAKVGRMVSAMVPMKFGPKIGALLQRYGSWETWSSTLNTITAGYGRIRITP